MPLSELSTNLPRYGSQTQTSDARGGKQSRSIPDPVSSMLRTSTETGDLSPFIMRPPRLSRSNSRLSSRSRSEFVTANATFSRVPSRRQLHPQEPNRRYPRPAPSHSALSRQDTGHSSLRSYHSSNARPRFRPPPPGRYGPDRRPSPASASGLYGHASLSNLRARSGYRATSPALSDAQSLPTYDYYPPIPRAPSVATAASSSLTSAFYNEFPYYNPDINNSTASFNRLPSPAIPGAYPGYQRSPNLSRRATPAPASVSSQHQTGNGTGSVVNYQPSQRPGTASSGPFYYDYTEAFADEYYQPPEHISPLFSRDHAIPEQGPPPSRHAQTPFGTVQGSAFIPSEMPTKYNRREDEMSTQDSSTMSTAFMIEEGRGSIPVLVRNLSTNQNQDQENGDSTRQETANPINSSNLRRDCSANQPSALSSGIGSDIPAHAAHVQPDFNGNAERRDPENDLSRENKEGTKSVETQEASGSNWQLPSLHFKPLSFLQRSNDDATRMSGPILRSSRPTIISPTPKRPISSQSRRRFSKILEMEDITRSLGRKRVELARSYNSLNSAKLRQILEGHEPGYHTKYSIPPFSPRHSVIMEPSKESESQIGSLDMERESRCDKSTIESLLDRHIECLGLGLEPRNKEASDGINESTAISTIGGNHDGSTVKLEADQTSEATVNFQEAIFNSTASIEPLRLRPAESAPCLSQFTSEDSVARPSYGWNTLNSSSNLSSIGLVRSSAFLNNKLVSDNKAGSIDERQPRPSSQVSPRSSMRKSMTSQELYSWDDDPSGRQRSRSREFVRQVSQRRKMRIRLKLRRESQGSGPLQRRDSRATQRSLDVNSLPTASHMAGEGITKEGAGLNGEDEIDHAAEVQVTPRFFKEQLSEHEASVSPPDIPKRLSSSVVATPGRLYRRSRELARKISVTTMRSHHSHGSVIDPVNSTRMSAAAPHIGAPDLGPSLNSISLNMNFAFPPPAAAPIAPRGFRRKSMLMTGQSYFSDDSSAVPDPQSSLRKRFNLPSLRGVLPTSPTARSNPKMPGRYPGIPAARPRPGPPEQFAPGVHVDDSESDYYDTVGMSEFAYRKRKLVDRVKGWWRRQCVQKKRAKKRQQLGPLEGL